MNEIKDSGTRRTFRTGAVRDAEDGANKGRCDLLPLDIIGEHMRDVILELIGRYVYEGNPADLWKAIFVFQYKAFPANDVTADQRMANALLEVSKHYAKGCEKYQARNWEKGIDLHCYIDSAVRHYLKFKRGDKDEPHHHAVIWNLLGAIWTQKHLPELIDLPFVQNNGKNEDV